ncbi:tRNA1(Val) (adenine(37)-N6)-methyltransferase [Alkalicoccus chagannorensis]|uniref:tRNA1(Val) (adenine(37)-N6)-methyltransferase n=1 Tax=Alkalicoccus chagannorensis TaxID=427072 RepID=UPI00041E3245|nr:tRNA1(Val) (adenine(37)-N6)-methyltransferase [Alkalicoccus chagannorensis]
MTELRLDDLPGFERRIYQHSGIFAYSMDAVLLGRFARVDGARRMLDLCAGTGAVPLVLSTRTKTPIDAVEVQEQLCRLMEMSVEENDLQTQIHPAQADLRTLSPDTWGRYDVITCNPPYFPVQEKEKYREDAKAIARHELLCTWEDIARACRVLLQSKGRAAFVHRPERTAELTAVLQAHQLEPKRLQFCHPHAEKEANMVLIEAVKDGKPGLHVEAPLIVYDEHRQYTKAFEAHYTGKEETHA